MGSRVKIPEAARLTGLSEYAIRQGIRQGRYPYIRTGLGSGTIIIDMELLEQYLRQEAVDNAQRHTVEASGVINYGKLRKVSE